MSHLTALYGTKEAYGGFWKINELKTPVVDGE
jgi:hypothetical protein